ncbi:GumC family protein, partial [Planctomycetota bacterium]
MDDAKIERSEIAEQEIDLREYVLVLVRRKWLIVGLTVLLAIAVGIWSKMQPKIYEATASVAMYRLRSEIMFAPEFKTIVESESSASRNIKEKSKGLVALVQSGAVARKVAEELDKELSEKERQPFALLRMVKGEVEGDIIRISVSNIDREKAALIADAWARAYEQHINAIYSSASVETSMDPTRIEFESTRARYLDAERKLVESIENNAVTTSQRIIAKKTAILSALKIESERGFSVLRDELADHAAEQRRLKRLLGNAKGLFAQVSAEEGASTGSALALLMLQGNVYAGGTGASGVASERMSNWQLDLASLTELNAAKQKNEATVLIEVLKKRLAEIGKAIETASGKVLRKGGTASTKDDSGATPSTELTLRRIEKEINELMSGIAKQEAQKKELARARDQAWETFKTLARKMDELRIARQVPDSEVKMASEAVVPEVPVSPQPRKYAMLGAVVGLMLSCLLAFFLEFLKTVP